METSGLETTLRTRRGVLAGLGGGLVALAAQAIGRPDSTRAGTSYVVLGEENVTDTATTIHNTTSGGTALHVVSGNGRSVFGSVSDFGTGVEGQGGPAGYGVKGYGAIGVYGESVTGNAVFGWSAAAAEPAILGQATGGSTGVQGLSWTGDLPSPPGQTGVHGSTNGDQSSRGVSGTATAGQGLRGTATTGVGVFASAGPRGSALEADGRVQFSTSGLVAIPAGSSSRTVTPGVGLTASSRILCTLESDQAGLFVHRVTKDTAADTFRVFLDTVVQAGRTARVAWFVIG